MSEPLSTVWLHAQFTVHYADGLHARPAIKLSQLARQFASAIEVRAAGEPQWVDAKSIARLMALRVAGGQVIEARACGDDAGSAMARLGGFFEAGYTDENEGLE